MAVALRVTVGTHMAVKSSEGVGTREAAGIREAAGTREAVVTCVAVETRVVAVAAYFVLNHAFFKMNCLHFYLPHLPQGYHKIFDTEALKCLYFKGLKLSVLFLW
ncbi:MAG: hypothetical protein LUE14_09165 [Clostridiales bacterium]|nr:hypothetical protein [Clostridiales bacterium]